MAFSPDSELLVAGGWSVRIDIKLWCVSTRGEYAEFVPRATDPMEWDQMIALTFSSDGQRVLCATKLHNWSWNTATGDVTDSTATDERQCAKKKARCMFSLNGESIAFQMPGITEGIFAGKSSGGRMTCLKVFSGLIWNARCRRVGVLSQR